MVDDKRVVEIDIESSDPTLPDPTAILNFDQPDSLVGRRLDGRFIIEKNLTDGGADIGGIGVVYLARDTKLMGKEVVVKILNETALQYPDIVRKFQHEKEALIRLDHPGIVRILDSGTLTDGNPFMVMEYIKGHSLRKALEMAGRLPLEVVASIVESVTDALSAAHSEEILHRDIKPENIMLTPLDEGQYRVRLIDFGIARVGDSKLAPATEISRTIGTVLYMAPEQLIGHLDLTPAGDIYSTAIVVYEMLTGELPFKPKAIAEMYQLQKEGVKILPSALRADMPREAERILLSALEFAPENRPQIARVFGRCLAHELRIDGQESDRYFASLATEYFPRATDAISVPDPTDFETVQRSVSYRPTALKLIVPAILALALAIVGGAYIAGKFGLPTPVALQGANNAAELSLSTERRIAYFATIQKMRGGKPFGEPYRSTGQAGVEVGYRFGLTFIPESEGYMYVFNKGKDDAGVPIFSILFPTPGKNNGSASIDAGQKVETSSATVEGRTGMEVIYLIWSKDRQDDLENVRVAAFENGGTINDANHNILQKFLEKHEGQKPDATKAPDNQQMHLKALGDIVVYQFTLEHH